MSSMGSSSMRCFFSSAGAGNCPLARVWCSRSGSNHSGRCWRIHRSSSSVTAPRPLCNGCADAHAVLWLFRRNDVCRTADLRSLVEGAVLHDRQQAVAILEDADVGQRVAFDQKEISEITGLDLAEFVALHHDLA